MRIFGNILFLFTLALVPLYQAHAYLDPGSGSFLFQLIVGAVLSGLFAIKIYFRRIKGFFNRQDKNKTDKDKSQDNETA